MLVRVNQLLYFPSMMKAKQESYNFLFQSLRHDIPQGLSWIFVQQMLNQFIHVSVASCHTQEQMAHGPLSIFCYLYYQGLLRLSQYFTISEVSARQMLSLTGRGQLHIQVG